MTINSIEINQFNIIAGEKCETAAEELRLYLARFFFWDKQACKDSDYKIIVGLTGEELNAFPFVNELKFDDSFLIIYEDKTLIIAGKTPEGTLYGVYHLLNMLGVEWLTPDAEIFKGDPFGDIKIDKIIYNFTSRLRIIHCGSMYDEKFRARQRLKFTVGKVNRKPAFGGINGVEFAFDWGLFGHTFEVLVPYEKYFKDHPEYFSFAPNRYGDSGRFQLCLTNKEVFDIALDTILDYLKNNPTCKIVSVSQNDSYGDFAENYCMCPNCKAVCEREGSYSGVMLQFVNRIAEEVEKVYPDIYIHTFAYHFTKKPPLHIRPRKNVIVQYCTGKPFNRCLNDDEDACRREREEIDRWHEICDNLYLWMYWCNFGFYLVPIANFKAIYYDTVYCLRKGVYGIFQQSNGDNYPFEFYDLRNYLLAKLFQNPDMSYDDYRLLMREFVTGFYGEKSAEYILSYIDLLCDFVEKLSPLYESKEQSFTMLSDESFINKGTELWEKALAKAEGDEYRARIERSKISFDFCRLMKLWNEVKEGRGELGEYIRCHRRLVEFCYSYHGKFIYAEGIGNQIKDISNLNYSLSPFSVRNRAKTIDLREEGVSVTQSSEATTDPSVRDFGFEFTVSRKGLDLIFDIRVKDRACTHCLDNMYEWEQDSVEIYFSETNHKNKNILPGDYKVRVNSKGGFTAFGQEGKIRHIATERTDSGYNIKLIVSIEDVRGDRLGFELIAHNIGDDGYINTVYWNSIARADMALYPYTLGDIIIR